MKTYSEKLKDPRWQRRRLEIMERDQFACACCGGGDETLHVHHALYKKGREPWEYNDDELVTYCATCHKSAEESREIILKALIQPFEGEALHNFAGAVRSGTNVFWMAYLAACFNPENDKHRTRKSNHAAAAVLLERAIVPIQQRIDELKRMAEDAPE